VLRLTKNILVRKSPLQVGFPAVVSSRRDHGGLIFIDLRDKDEVVQLVCDPADNADAHKIAEDVRDQFVLIAMHIK